MDESPGLVILRSANSPIWRNFLSGLIEQYDFLAERNRTYRNVWMINPRCPFKRHELRRRGRLQIGRDGQWRSEESLSFHALRYNKIVGCYHREYPMGWAAISTQSSLQNLDKADINLPNFSRQVFWRWERTQRRGTSLTQLFGRSAETTWASKGLGRYAALSLDRETKPIRISLEVSQKRRDQSVIRSVATAQTYFLPPARSTSRFPYRASRNIPSLFDPYWRATLIPNVVSQ
jgi:hypothetical protein